MSKVSVEPWFQRIVFIAIKNYESVSLFAVLELVLLRGETSLYPLGVILKISNEHLHPFYTGVLPGRKIC